MKLPKTGYTPINIVVTVFFYIAIISNGFIYFETERPIYATLPLLSAVLLVLFRHYFINGHTNHD